MNREKIANRVREYRKKPEVRERLNIRLARYRKRNPAAIKAIKAHYWRKNHAAIKMRLKEKRYALADSYIKALLHNFSAERDMIEAKRTILQVKRAIWRRN